MVGVHCESINQASNHQGHTGHVHAVTVSRCGVHKQSGMRPGMHAAVWPPFSLYAALNDHLGLHVQRHNMHRTCLLIHGQFMGNPVPFVLSWATQCPLFSSKAYWHP